MTHHQIHTKEFLVGAAVGSLLGGVAALFTAPKSGRELREDISDACCDATHRTQNLAQKGKSFVNDIGCRTCNLGSKAKNSFGEVGKNIKSWVGCEEECEEEGKKDLFIGGLAGAILGATIGLLLAPKAGDELRQDIVDTYDDVSDRAQKIVRKGKSYARSAQSKRDKWLNVAKHVVEELSENVHDTSDDWLEKAKNLVDDNRVNDVIDWATLGLRVWKGITSKR